MLLNTDTTAVTESPEHRALELEPMDEDEEGECDKTLSGGNEEPENPDPADHEGAAAEESDCITKSICFLPQNKEELERTIKNIQGTITGDILPRLHKCLASTVIILSGTQQAFVNSGVYGPVSD